MTSYPKKLHYDIEIWVLFPLKQPQNHPLYIKLLKKSCFKAWYWILSPVMVGYKV